MEFAVVIKREVFHLYIDGHGVVVIHGFEGDQVVGSQLLELHQDGLDLDREDVDALEDDHVVAAALHAIQPDVMTATGAFSGQDAGQVTGTIAQQRHGLALERGQHQFTDFSVRNGFEGVRIHNLHNVVVFPNVHAVLLGTFEGDTGTAHLRHAEGVVRLHAQHLFDALARILGVRLGTDHEGAESGVPAGIDALFTHDLIQAGGVRRDGVHHGGAEVREELQLTQGVAGRCGDGKHAHLLGAVLEAESAGEHPVARCVLENVLGTAAHHPQAAGDGIGPFVQVLL